MLLFGFVMLFPALLFFSCRSRNRQYESPPYYNFNVPYIIKLPGELEEISGISYYAKDNSLFAESDEKGCLYKIFLNKPGDIRKWKFSHKDDYEDVVLHDSIFYILNSNGDIITIRFINDSFTMQRYNFPEKGSFEFESLYYDDKLQKLVLLCKDCDIDKKISVSTYTFDPRQLIFGQGFTIDTRKILDDESPISTPFKPSAASINPVTNELYMLSSINKMLVVASRSGEIKRIYHLNPSLFGHPEGITFNSAGGLFISNEAVSPKASNILYYQFQKNKE